MIDLKESLNEAMTLFRSAMESVKKESKWKDPEAKEGVANAEEAFATYINNVVENTKEDADAYLALARLYYEMDDTFESLTSGQNTKFRISFIEKCVYYIDLYKKEMPDIKDVELGIGRFGMRVMEDDVRKSLADAYHRNKQYNKALSYLGNLFDYYAHKYGKDSKEYAQRLFNILPFLHGPSEQVAFVEKWADEASTIKEYSNVWKMAAFHAGNIPQQTLEDKVANVRKVIEYYERAESLNHSRSTQTIIMRCKKSLEVYLRQLSSK